jgi:hypothetical protein
VQRPAVSVQRVATVLGNRYRMEETVGSGGMGAVWRAVDEVLGRQVAVKVIDLAMLVEPAAEARFRREVQVTAALDHPNIVTVFDAGSDGRTLYSVMELLAGPSLADVVRHHAPLPTETAVGYGRQICAGLSAAHAAGVVHRDLKPANAVFAASGLLKLVDFGIARVVAETTQADLTAPSSVVGTPGYVSPEAAVGGAVDARSDLYALGCVLFALLTGRPPFAGDTPLQTLGQHVHAPVPDLAGARPDVPPALVAVVSALLAKDPAARPAGAADVERLLATSLTSSPWGPPLAATTALATTGPQPEPTAVEPATEPAATAVLPAGDGRGRRRRLLPLAAVGLIAVGLLAWLAAAGGGGHGGHPPTSTTARPTTTTTVAPTTTIAATTTTTPTTTTVPTTTATVPVTTAPAHTEVTPPAPATTAPKPAPGGGPGDQGGGPGGHGHGGS